MTVNKYGTLNAEAIIQYDQGRPATPYTDDIYYLLRSIADKPHLAPITIQHFVESARRDAATGIELRLPITRSEYESKRREVWAVVLVPPQGPYDKGAVDKEVARDVRAVEALGIPWKDQRVETGRIAHVFLVEGQSGSHSDLSRWPVAVWSTREEADLHAANCMLEVKRIEDYIEMNDEFGYPLLNPPDWALNRCDPAMDWNYELSYSVREVPLAPKWGKL